MIEPEIMSGVREVNPPATAMGMTPRCSSLPTPLDIRTRGQAACPSGRGRSVGLFKHLGPGFQVMGSLTRQSAPRRDVAEI